MKLPIKCIVVNGEAYIPLKEVMRVRMYFPQAKLLPTKKKIATFKKPHVQNPPLPPIFKDYTGYEVSAGNAFLDCDSNMQEWDRACHSSGYLISEDMLAHLVNGMKDLTGVEMGE